ASQRWAGAGACLTVVMIGSACGSASPSDSIGPITPPPVTSAADTTPLRALASKHNIHIGAAIDAGFRLSGSEGALFRGTFTREFDLLTPENDMKHERIEDGTRRPGFWLDHIGLSYIELAFRAAHEADPSAQLFYNDYNIEGINAKSMRVDRCRRVQRS